MRTDRSDDENGHRFAIGSMVRLRKSFAVRNARPGEYEVVAQLPDSHGEHQYRIKSDCEPYQRIVKETQLETV
jgi:hypothetical protein